MSDRYFFLNVGCADTTVLHLGDKVVMVDCHQGDVYDGEEDILDYVPKGHIDVLILTHAHYDHFDGIRTLLEDGISVGEVWESNYERRRGDPYVEYDEWQGYQKLLQYLGAKRYNPTRSTEAFDVVGGARFQFYNPREDINDDPTRHIHDASLVFTVRKSNDSITFAGDASDAALKDLTDYFDLKRKHILHASHHGSIEGAHLEFIKKMNPNYTIISTKAGVHSNVPHPTALSR
jgi:beta-lactamase superfamily II metal-dependent hydrolase